MTISLFALENDVFDGDLTLIPKVDACGIFLLEGRHVISSASPV